jgi:hypothetical protein
MAERAVAYSGLMPTPEGGRPLGRPTCRWEANIKTDLQEIVWEGVGWVDAVDARAMWRAVVNVVMNWQIS